LSPAATPRDNPDAISYPFIDRYYQNFLELIRDS
jgi:hypothetical protein